ncbi:hypothetical protein [Alkaliphilus hydrothermalis]|uniref:Uncharacterized protein n=1 Tax=Alkaliphilus hydrothermalis TaxID=1482730 RepID=A0ABS2NLR2_9FIRM|nr:hypothetical protein [Alkaliphilus hydrothermalis]MBM7613873.1 hypothetical protein [Alkaliphilus hydrothermalis]
MVKNNKLSVLQGGKGSNKRSYRFVEAIATQTRLMGVVALKLHWVNQDDLHLVQWFLLDAEEYGIYDAISVKTTKEEETDKYTGQFMGSLGGEKVEISRKEAYFLIQTFTHQNKIHRKPLPRQEGYRFILATNVRLKADEIEELNNKIFEKILCSSQLINFFIMRSVARDHGGMVQLLKNPQIKKLSEYMPLKRAGVLLKNKVRKSANKDIYIADSVVEMKGNYYLLKWKVVISEAMNTYRVEDAKVIKRQLIPSEEAALEIQNPEYIKLFKVKVDEEEILQYFDTIDQDLLRYRFPQGTMYVEFRKNNRHVMRELYHIGGDIKAIYFINHFQQLIVCYYHEDDLPRLEDAQQNTPLKELIDELDTFERRGSIIYEYAEAAEVDFFDYLYDID